MDERLRRKMLEAGKILGRYYAGFHRMAPVAVPSKDPFGKKRESRLIAGEIRNLLEDEPVGFAIMALLHHLGRDIKVGSQENGNERSVFMIDHSGPTKEVFKRGSATEKWRLNRVFNISVEELVLASPHPQSLHRSLLEFLDHAAGTFLEQEGGSKHRHPGNEDDQDAYEMD